MKFPVVYSHKNYGNLYKKLCDGLFLIVNNPLLFLTDKNYKDFMKIAKISAYFYAVILFKKIAVTNTLKNPIYR
ncbi:MAG: hypothetical protein RM338_04010 [Nostoc sp. DedQUE12a]|nr:hypothetical protein [Nostoc sp. DedQUE12a]